MTWDGVSDVQALRGLGVEGTWLGTRYLVGSPRLFAERGLPTDEQAGQAEAAGAADLDSAACTPVLVGTQRELLGKVLLADPPRPDAAQAVAELRRLGITRLVMLSGDSPLVARRAAALLGIDDVRAGLLPEQKVEVVQQLRREAAHLAMVGDGVNDAPAMAAATLGIALGPHASDTALETADVAVLVPRVTRVPELIRIGRRLHVVLRENIVLALGIKAGVLLLALLGPPELARLWLAVAADVGASLLVIVNGMRMLRASAS
jgi:Cd2+/Zn2+-exporting ATPase